MVTGLSEKRSPAIMAAAVFALLMLTARPVSASAYDPPNVARLSGIVGEAYVLGKGDTEWSYAEPNLVVERGDLLQTNETGMAEVQFERRLTLRIGENARAAMVELAEKKVVGLDRGSAYIRITEYLPAGAGFVVTFPAGQLTAIGETLARIDVRDDGGADLRVFRGRVELETASEPAQAIRSGRSLFINPDGGTRFAYYDPAQRDEFDTWNEERDIALSIYERPDYIAEDIVGAEDLEGYGEWVYSGRVTTHVWRPYVVETWKPYYNGRWYYSSYSGWTWIAEEPWGYATHHYGAWEYDPYYGWVWVPGYEYRPAHVSWVTYDDYVGWVPIGYHGYPVVTTYPYYVTDAFVDFAGIFSITFFHTSHFNHHGHHHGHHGHHDDHRGHHDDDDHHDGHHNDDGNAHHDGDGDGHHDGGDGELNTPNPENSDGIGEGGEQVPSTARTRKEKVRDRLPADRQELDLDRIKDAKLRFTQNPENLNKLKNSPKGRSAIQKLDREKILDMKGHPELGAKVAKWDDGGARAGKIRTASTSAGLPKKVSRESAGNFDFRSQLKERKASAPKIRRAQHSNGRLDSAVSSGSLASKNRDAPSRIDKARGAAESRGRMPQNISTDQASRRRDNMGRHRKKWDEFKRARDAERMDRSRRVSLAGRKSARTIEINERDIKRAQAGVGRENSRFAVSSIPRERVKMRERPKVKDIPSAIRAPQVREASESRRSDAARSEASRRGMSRRKPSSSVRQMNTRQSARAIDRTPSMPARSAPERVNRSGSSRGLDRRIARPAPTHRAVRQPSVVQGRTSSPGGERALSGRSARRSGMNSHSGSKASNTFARSRGHRRR